MKVVKSKCEKYDQKIAGEMSFSHGQLNRSYHIVNRISFKICCFLFLSAIPSVSQSFPNICTVASSPFFQSCLGLKTTQSVCGDIVPRPCVHFTYYVPQYFIEVTSNPKESFFSKVPGAAGQLALAKEFMPFGTDNDEGSHSFYAHTINVPLAALGFSGLPCGGTLLDTLCFSAMSEHLGMNWKTGLGDSWQPQWLAWGLAPKACLAKAAITSTLGGSRATDTLPMRPCAH